VTGSSRGLGKNTALTLAKKGVDTIVTYHNSDEEAKSVVSAIASIGAKAVALQLDTSNTKTFDGFVEQVKQSLKDKWQTEHFDFLVNNAGIGIHASFVDTTEDDFDRLMNIHVKGVFFLTQKLLPLINDGGRIMNISSGLARFTTPGYAAYASMKGAIEVLTRYMAKELGHRQYALNYGVTPEELMEVIYIITVTSGYPRALIATATLKELFQENNIKFPVTSQK
jgi:NAD(P)-dependent dehydrogenase (short-subunit alcohol dehydrogenase family)